MCVEVDAVNYRAYLFDGYVLHEPTDDGTRMAFRQLHCIDVQRVGVRVLPNFDNLTDFEQETRHVLRLF